MMATGIMYKNFVKFEHVVFEICQQRDRDRHTDMETRSSQYFAPVPASKYLNVSQIVK